jgi:hypothetical protein
VSDEVSEAEFDRVLARTFGRSGPASDPDPANVALFREAGFDDADARRGAKMMESGRYLGFEDAATSMLVFRFSAGRISSPAVSEARIAEVAKKAAGLDVSEGGK